MAGKYLKSLTTGVVLPYNEPALKNANMRLMEPAECEEYERSLGLTAEAAPAPVPEPEPAPEPAPTPAVETLPDEENLVVEPDDGVAEVIQALEVD